MAAITITAPLVSYEKKLLDNFRTSFLGDSPARRQLHQERRDYAFSRWYWTRYSLETFQFALQSKYNLHKGDWNKMWECFVHLFRNKGDESNFSRVEALRLNHYPERWDFTIPILNNIKVMPDEKDLPYWDFIAELLTFYEEAEPTYSDPLVGPGSSAQGIEPENCTVDALVTQLIAASFEGRQMPEPSDVQLEIAYSQHWDFQIWSLVRSCALLHRRIEGGPSAREGLRMAGFYDRHDAVRNGFLLKPTRDPPNPGGVARRGYSARTPKSLKLGSFGMDPLKYVEYIPWADLSPCGPEHLISEFRNDRFMYWSPQQSMQFERFLYTEEDVFQFCVQFNVTFPDYLFHDKVLFILSRIKEFSFESLANDYWRHWSDCAITKDPRTGEWFLLQTIPGFRFRSLRNQQNHTTSLQYFRNIVDNIRFGRPQQPSEVLGRYFQPNYKNLLNLIPFQEITYIDPSPIGRGDKGVVHRAVWSCPRKIGMWSAETIDVALKSLKVPGTQDLEHFMRELDASFAAFQSKAIGCIELLGILMTPPREAHSISNRPISVLQTETLFLVLEFATEGSIIGYLNRTLTGQQSDWPVIIRFISNLANGLERVHDQGIIHRDIHPGNVLVTSRKDRGMPNRELPREPIALISDLGEGQLINNQSLGRACYGDPRYWAPEIRNSNTYSKASDVYAMGRLVADIVAVNWQIASNNGVVSKLIPQVLLEMIVNCQNPFPERRPSISEICQTLEDVRMSEKHNDLVLIPIDPEVLQSFISQSGNEPSGSSSSEIPT